MDPPKNKHPKSSQPRVVASWWEEGGRFPCCFLGRGSVPTCWVSQERGKCLGWLQPQEQPKEMDSSSLRGNSSQEAPSLGEWF